MSGAGTCTVSALGENFFLAGLSPLVVGNRDVGSEVGSIPDDPCDAVSIGGGRGLGAGNRRGCAVWAGDGAAEGPAVDLLESGDGDNPGVDAWGVRSGD